MPTRTNKRRSKGNNRIMDVRIADPAAGLDGAKIDRQISSIKQSESQTRMLIGDAFDVGVPTSADTLASWGFDQLFSTDDFASMLVQYNEFRVVSIKFDVYDINSAAAAYNTWGIWHDNYESSVPSYTRANITDLPDSRIISAGTGQTTLYWRAHGTAEQQFQATYSGGSTAQRFGGLKYYVGAGGSAVPKYSVIVHAVVDFRARR